MYIHTVPVQSNIRRRPVQFLQVSDTIFIQTLGKIRVICHAQITIWITNDLNLVFQLLTRNGGAENAGVENEGVECALAAELVDKCHCDSSDEIRRLEVA